MFRSFLPFLILALSCLVHLTAAGCGGDGERACCAPKRACDKGLKKVSLCSDELSKDSCKCGFAGSAARVCHKPPSSDEKKRMKEQHYIDYDAPLMEAMFIGTHNSYNNEKDDYNKPNNRVNMTDQLNLGLRVLNFDVHEYIGATKTRNYNPILCHDEVLGAALCKIDNTRLDKALRDINEWLKENKKEVLLIVIEDKMEHEQTRNIATQEIVNEIKDKAFTPYFDYSLTTNDCHSLPLNDSTQVTKRKLLESGKQVILTTAGDSSSCSHAWRKYVWNVDVDVYTGGEGLPTNDKRMSSSSKWIFIPEDRLFGEGLIGSVGSDGDKLLSRAEAKTVVEKGANVIGLDFPSEANRHKTLIWSWDNNEPNTSTCGSNNCCAIQKTNGKWKSVSCTSGSYKFACQSDSGVWTITSAKGSFKDGQKTCKSEGKGTFRVPVNGNYNIQLQRKAKSENVWLAYKNVKGFWKAHTNTAPTCDIAGPYTAECTGATSIQLDGSGSKDVDGDALTYKWRINRACASASTFSSTTSASPTITLQKTCSQTCKVTLQVSDGQESSSCSATLKVQDTLNPVSTSAKDKTVESKGHGGNLVALNLWLVTQGGASATDQCTSVTWSNDFSDGALSNGCGATGSATVVFTAQDECNRQIQTSATFTIEDTIPPRITSVASDMVVESDGLGNTLTLEGWVNSYGGAAALDGNGGVSWRNNFVALSDDCGTTGSSVVTFTAIDECGLTSSTSARFTIEDTTPPRINTVASDMVVESDGLGNTLALEGWVNSYGGAAASDVGGMVTWSNNFVALSDDCGTTGSSVVTFTAIDECGLTSSTSARFTIEDTTPPTITTAASDMVVESDGLGNTLTLEGWLNTYGGAAASDVGGMVTWSNDFVALSDDCGTTGSSVVAFTATDECGLTSSTSATFTIVDTTPPSIDTPSSSLTVESDGLGNLFDLDNWLNSQGGAIASDVGGSVTWSNTFSELSDLCGDTGSATVMFIATDECGLSSNTSAIFTIEDTTSPIIELVEVTTNPFPVNQVFMAHVEFSDVAGSPHTASWSWGDGSVTSPDLLTDPAVVDAGVVSANGDIFGSYTYPTSGIYELGLAMKDDCGNAANDVYGSEVIIYDPTAWVAGSGFVSTGNGKNEKAHYGFTIAYDKDATIPNGCFFFEDSVSGINVVGTRDFQWLVAVENTAIFQGRGTLNDSSASVEIMYRVWIEDNGNGGKNSGDKFRIRVMSLKESATLFDNDGADLIQGGNTRMGYQKYTEDLSICTQD